MLTPLVTSYDNDIYIYGAVSFQGVTVTSKNVLGVPERKGSPKADNPPQRCGPEGPAAGAKRPHAAEGREGKRSETVVPEAVD